MTDGVVAALLMLVRHLPCPLGDLGEGGAGPDQRDVPFQLLAGTAVEQLLHVARAARPAEEAAREIDGVAEIADGVAIEAENVAVANRASGAFLEIGIGARAALQQARRDILALRADEASLKLAPDLGLGPARLDARLHGSGGGLDATDGLADVRQLDRQLDRAGGGEDRIRVAQPI